MEWHRCENMAGLPEVDQDVELLIKPEDLPFQYLSVVWDGKTLWYFANNNDAPWVALDSSIHFKEWSYIVKPPLPRTYKRYKVQEDGSHFFNTTPPYDDMFSYEQYGYDNVFEMFLKIISHKKATISCDYLHKFNSFEEFPMGVSKILTFDLKSTDISLYSLYGILDRTMPWSDPDFKERERQFYDVEWPKECEKHKAKRIDEEIKKFRRENKKRPTKKDIAEIEREVSNNMALFGPPTITPGIYPEYNCMKVEVSEKIEDKDLDAFIAWLKSCDRSIVFHRLPNGKVREYKELRFSDWKFHMGIK